MLPAFRRVSIRISPGKSDADTNAACGVPASGNRTGPLPERQSSKGKVVKKGYYAALMDENIVSSASIWCLGILSANGVR